MNLNKTEEAGVQPECQMKTEAKKKKKQLFTSPMQKLDSSVFQGRGCWVSLVSLNQTYLIKFEESFLLSNEATENNMKKYFKTIINVKKLI